MFHSIDLTSFFGLTSTTLGAVCLHFFSKIWCNFFSCAGMFKLIRQNILEHMDAESIDEFSALAYGSSLTSFFIHRHFFRQIILYEDFLEHPRENTKDMFDILEIPEEHISKSLTALDKHSQGKFFGNTDGTKNDALVTEQWQKIMRIFQTLDVPVSPYMTLNEFRLLIFQK